MEWLADGINKALITPCLDASESKFSQAFVGRPRV